jgi:hypothetical protein
VKKNITITTILLVISFCGIRESEPTNNHRRGAKLLADGDSSRGNFLSNLDRDIDFFKLDISEKKMLSGNLSAVKGLDTKMVILPFGSEIPIKTINDQGSSLGEKFGPILIKPPGAYIKVTHQNIISDTLLKEIPYEFSIKLTKPIEPTEIEPNDYLAQAQVIEDKILGFYSNAVAFSPGKKPEPERDYFLIPITEKGRQLMEVRLSAVPGIDPVLRLLDKDGKVLRQIDERGLNQGELLSSYGLGGQGQIYLSVTAKDQQIETDEFYELSVSINDYENQYEFEPNDKIDDATLLTEASTRAELSGAIDKDYYLLQNANDYEADINIEVRPSENGDIKLSLLTESADLLNEYADSGRGEPEGISLWRLRPQEKIYLVIESSLLAQTESAPYIISMNLENSADGHEQEPNNQPVNAMSISTGNLVGFINPANDVDTFVLEDLKEVSYKVILEPMKSCTPKLKVGDNKAAFYLQKAARLEEEGISITFKSEGTTYIQISCDKTSFGLYRNPYRLSITEATVKK